MNSKDFMNEMIKEGEKYSDNAFETVARMRLQFGYSGYLAGERPVNLFKPCGGEKGDAARVSDEVSGRLKKRGATRGAVFAILLSIPAGDNTNERVTWDTEQVVLQDAAEDSEYQLFIKALDDVEAPINEWFWGAYKNKVVGEYEKDGETKKRYLSLLAKVFPNEAAARAAVGGGSSKAADNSQWSDTARANYKDIDILTGQAAEIGEWYTKMVGGTAFNNDPENFPLPAPRTPPNVKAQLAELYQVESADIDLLMAEVPF